MVVVARFGRLLQTVGRGSVCETFSYSPSWTDPSAVLTVKPRVSVFGTCGHTADCRPVSQAASVEIFRCSAVIQPLYYTYLKRNIGCSVCSSLLLV